MSGIGQRLTDQVTSIAMKQISAYDKARGAVCLRYSYKDIDITHNVLLASQPCHYGGVRYWFICQYCHKQAGIIYLSGDQCACRDSVIQARCHEACQECLRQVEQRHLP